jgi:parvulin-like peptidyl-prolyl isomerase
MIRSTFSKTLLAALAMTLLSCPSVIFAVSAPGADTSDAAVATGKGFQITRSQLDDAFLSYNTSMAANGGSVPEDQRTEVKSNLLNHLIINQILTQKATAEDKDTTRKKVDEAIDTARAHAPSPEAFDAQIKATGMSLDQVRKRAYEEQLCRRVLTREVTNGVSISDAEAKKFYDSNSTNFDMPEEVRVAHILIGTTDPLNPQVQLSPEQKAAKKKLAEQVRAKAVSGEDFAKLVNEYSDDTGSKSKGGEYTFPRHSRMVPEFEAAAFSLKTNQISDLVETQYGYHILKLLEKIPPTHQSFAVAEPKIKEYLLEVQADKLLPAYLNRIKAEADVKILDPALGGTASRN